MFLQVSICPQGGGMRDRGRAWQGACMAGGMHGRGCAWWVGMRGRGGMRGDGGGVCMAGGAQMAPRQILWDTVNERAVRILLECILVLVLQQLNEYHRRDGFFSDGIQLTTSGSFLVCGHVVSCTNRNRILHNSW